MGEGKGIESGLWVEGRQGGKGYYECPCLCPSPQRGHEGLRAGEGWRGMEGAGGGIVGERRGHPTDSR